MSRHAPGAMYNWKARQNVFDCIANYVGSHGEAVIYTSKKFDISESTIYRWIADGSIVNTGKQTKQINNVVMHEYLTNFLFRILQILIVSYIMKRCRHYYGILLVTYILSIKYVMH